MKTTNTQNDTAPGHHQVSSSSSSTRRTSNSNSNSTVTPEEFQQLLIATADLPFIHQVRVETDYMLDVMETVLNLHIQEPVVVNALNHFQKRHNQSPVQELESACISTHQQLENALSGFPDSEDGNKAASQYLWGNNHWTRLEMLRRFLVFLASNNITDQPSLHAWAKQAEFERDFKGKVKGLSIAVFHWLLIRCGVPSVKPDIWVINFAHRVTGKRISGKKLVKAFAEIAPLIGQSQQTIDLTIWHYEKLAMATTDAPQLRIVWWHLFKQQLEAQLLASPDRATWLVALDDTEKLRYGKAGVLISNCCSMFAGSDDDDAGFNLNQKSEPKPKSTIEVHQSVWHEGFELEMRVITESALSPADVDRLNAWLTQEKLDWEICNEQVFTATLDLEFSLKVNPGTCLHRLKELAGTITEGLVAALAELRSVT